MNDLIITHHRFRPRSVALAVAALIAGATVLTPALGQTAALFTKAKAKKLFLENTNVFSTPTAIPDGTGAAIQVLCPAGTQATNGGVDSPASNNTASEGLLLAETRPIQSGARSVGWYVEVINNSPNPISATAYAVCSK